MSYEPTPMGPVVDAQDLADYLHRELIKLSEELTRVNHVLITTRSTEPSKPQEGMVVIADGVSWNPGSGGGFYGYFAGAWRLLS